MVLRLALEHKRAISGHIGSLLIWDRCLHEELRKSPSEFNQDQFNKFARFYNQAIDDLESLGIKGPARVNIRG